MPPASTLRELTARPTVLVALIFLAAMLVASVAGGWLAPYSASATNVLNGFAHPSGHHLFGTDELGRDVFSRVVVGARWSMVAVGIVLISALTIGTIVGGIAGYTGGLLDEVLMRITDVFLAFPALLLALAIAATLGPSLSSGIVSLTVVWWPGYARLVRGQVLAVKQSDYVDATRSLGGSHTRVLIRHILPNSLAPVFVQLTLDLGNILVFFAGLSYLGAGAPAGTAEWGAMVNEGQSYLLTSWWISVFPGLAIFLSAVAFNVLGEALQELFNPERPSQL